MKRVNPENIAYAGVYKRVAVDGTTTFYINYRRKGKLVWEKIGAKPEFSADVAREIRNNRARRAILEIGDDKSITMDEAFSEFITTYARMQQLHDLRSIISRYNTHIGPQFGSMALKDITNIMINRQKVHWIKAVSLSTVKQIMSLMSRIFYAMGGNGLGLYLGPNPVVLAKKVEVENSRLRFLTKQESLNLMAYLKDTNLQTYRICAFCLYAGLRKQEALSIRRVNIDLENNILIIKTKDKRQGKMAALPIMPQLRSIIEDILGEMYYAPNEPLFRRTKFNYRAFYKAVDFHGLNDSIDWDDPDILPGRYKVVLHTLRHSFASHLIGEGVPLETVRRLMRHSSISATEIYAKVNDQQLKDGIDVLTAAWRKEENADSETD